MTVRVFDHEDLAAVKRVLDSGQLCSIEGTATRDFEQAFGLACPHQLRGQVRVVGVSFLCAGVRVGGGCHQAHRRVIEAVLGRV